MEDLLDPEGAYQVLSCKMDVNVTALPSLGRQSVGMGLLVCKVELLVARNRGRIYYNSDADDASMLVGPTVSPIYSECLRYLQCC